MRRGCFCRGVGSTRTSDGRAVGPDPHRAKAQFGMIGMGRNLALNILDHDYSVAGYNLGPELMQPASSLTQLVSGISPRGYASRGGAPSATSRPE